MAHPRFRIPALVGTRGFLFVVVLALASPSGYAAEYIQVDVSGVAAGVAQGSAEEAAENARREALLQYFEAHLPVAGMAAALKPLLARPSSYVDSERLNGVRVENGMTQAELTLTLNESLLRRDVARVVGPMLSDRVTLFALVGQHFANEPLAYAADGPAQRSVAALLDELPTTRVDPGEVLPYWAPADVTAGLSGDAELAAALGAYAFADVGVIGRCSINSRPAEGGGNLIENHVRLVVQVYDCRKHDLIREFEQEAQVSSLEPETGIAQAVSDATEKLRDRILVEVVFASAQVGLDDRIHLSITGMDGENEFDAFTAWLEAQLGPPSVDSIHYHPDRSRVAVDYFGPVAGFVRALTGARFEGFSLSIQSAVMRDVELAAK